MKLIVRALTILLFFSLTSCFNEKAKQDNSEENQIRLKELELKERELELRERELSKPEIQSTNNQESLSDKYESLKRGVFLILTENNDVISQGSAFVIDRTGLAISNYHVFRDASDKIAINDFGDVFMISEIVEYNEYLDYIIFRLGNYESEYFLETTAAMSKIGENVFTIGNPGGLTQTLSTGIISGYRDQNNFIQTTTPITFGSSGGPLFNEQGQVIGVTTGGRENGNLNFALNINSIPFDKFRNEKRNIQQEVRLTDNEVKSIIKEYYKIVSDEDWDRLLEVYSNTLSRFYNRFNVTKYEAVNSAKNYMNDSGILRAKYFVRWNTVETFNSSLGTEVRFIMDYEIERKDKSKPSKFVLNIVMMIDNNKQVKSIYENILRKM